MKIKKTIDENNENEFNMKFRKIEYLGIIEN